MWRADYGAPGHPSPGKTCQSLSGRIRSEGSPVGRIHTACVPLGGLVSLRRSCHRKEVIPRAWYLAVAWKKAVPDSWGHSQDYPCARLGMLPLEVETFLFDLLRLRSECPASGCGIGPHGGAVILGAWTGWCREDPSSKISVLLLL